MTQQQPAFANTCREVIAQLDDAATRLAPGTWDDLNRAQEIGRALAVVNIQAAKETLTTAATASWSDEDEARYARTAPLADECDEPDELG